MVYKKRIWSYHAKQEGVQEKQGLSGRQLFLSRPESEECDFML